MNKDSVIIVTGGAGFIGSNMVKYLNDKGFENIIIVDDMTDGTKFKNLKGLSFSAYKDKDEFLSWLEMEGIFYENPVAQMADSMGFTEEDEIFYEDGEGELKNVGESLKDFKSNIGCVIHMGAISSTQEWDGKKMMKENYSFTIELLEICQYGKIPFIYASSASVYGNKNDGSADPLNMYAFSKFSIDQWVMKFVQNKLNLKNEFSPIVGLRFFNVYGPREDHKLKLSDDFFFKVEFEQCSPIHKWIRFARYNQKTKKLISSIEVFNELSERDFVYVEDVCDVIHFFMQNERTGIFDVGTGVPTSFEKVADILISKFPEGTISKSMKPMPDGLKGRYQYFTKANLDNLRKVGYKKEFLSVEEGIDKMIKERI